MRVATPRILIVDDDHQQVRLLTEDLQMEGYDVLFGFDGGAAIAMAQAAHPDVLILDIDMPVANGIDALTTLRKIPITQSIPIIFITGMQSKVLYPIIDRHQRVAYLKKPIDLNDFNSMVKKFLAEFPTQKPAPQVPAPPADNRPAYQKIT